MSNPFRARPRAGRGTWQGPAEGQTAVLPTVPDDAQATAKALAGWVGDDPRRAEAARAVNDARSSPWKTVAQHVDTILG